MQILCCRFYAGIVLGLGGGPLYFILHLNRKVRESKNWDNISDGANIGMAVLGAYLAARHQFPFGSMEVQ